MHDDFRYKAIIYPIFSKIIWLWLKTSLFSQDLSVLLRTLYNHQPITTIYTHKCAYTFTLENDGPDDEHVKSL